MVLFRRSGAWSLQRVVSHVFTLVGTLSWQIYRKRLTQASPAPGGVRRVDSEEKGWELWTEYLNAGKVCVVPRT